MNENNEVMFEEEMPVVVAKEGSKEAEKAKYAVDVFRFAKVALANAKGVVKEYKIPVDANGNYKQQVNEDGSLKFDSKGVPVMEWYPINEDNRINNDMIISQLGIEFNKGTLVKGANGTDERMPSLFVVLQPDVVSMDWGAKYNKGRKFEYKKPVAYEGSFLSECVPLTMQGEKNGRKCKVMVMEEDGFTPKFQFKAGCKTIHLPKFDGSFDSLFTETVKAELEKYRNSLTQLQWIRAKVIHQKGNYFVKFFGLDDKVADKLPMIIER